MLLAQDAASPLARWGDFYVVVGTAGATLTGLMFVVITLTTQARKPGNTDTVDAFATPNVVHFCAALLIAATLTTPWADLSYAGSALVAYGAAGVGYAALVARRARRQTTYRPVLEDWLFHVVFPSVAYAVLAAAGLALRRSGGWALFGAAAAAVALLFVGVHNAWDTVTYVTTTPGTPGAETSGGVGPDDKQPDPSSRSLTT